MRQKAITKNVIEKYLNEDVDKWESEEARIGFSRNQTLIDLTNIPSELKDKIINTYDTVPVASRSGLLNYFIEKKLKNLMDVIEEF